MRKDKKPKIRKLTQKLLLVPATEAVDELPPVVIEKAATKTRKKPKDTKPKDAKPKDEEPKKKAVKLIIEGDDDE